MRALTIRQPWLNEIVRGEKRVENRTWAVPSSVIGTVIALHASKSVDWDAESPPGHSWSHEHREGAEPFQLGCVIAVARIAGCHPRYHICNPTGIPQTVCSEWSAWGQFHWLLDEVRVLAEPVPCKGALGLWTVPDEIESAIRAQLGG